MPEQRKDQFSSASEVTSILAPWRVRATELDALLAWFLRADLTSEDSVARLRTLTGRDFGLCVWKLPNGGVRYWAPADDAEAATELRQQADDSRRRGLRVEILDSRMIPPGAETDRSARDVLRKPVSPEEFVAFYRSAQDGLRRTERWLANWHANEPKAQIYVSVPLVGLDDVRVDAALDQKKIALERPLRSELRSVSLVGELALAMFQRMVRAREVVVCPSCGEIETFSDVRHREICSKPECRAWYRAKWTREKYAADKARKKRGRGKTRRS